VTYWVFKINVLVLLEFIGSTPLIIAVTQVKDDVIRNRLIVLLLQAGANPNIGDRHCVTPLMHSILLRQKNSIRLLLDSVTIELTLYCSYFRY
jgi:ankyrin repeat protein